MKKSNLYTATGDAGTTSLVGGQRVSKIDDRLEAYGTIDELNSFIGVLVATPGVDAGNTTFLQSIQNKLFNIGAYLATDNAELTPEADMQAANAYGITPEDVSKVEHQIDALDAAVPALDKFLLPGGTLAAAQAHVCRTVARRAERRIIKLHQEHLVAPQVLKYINRLSDYFFALSRLLNHNANQPEIFWQKD
ncbi:MAG: cob(I)yrinic acid a,c-diamide adenosyltransferase [Muribaculaceae bacterium]|nr:cob(I)yrinic acid a,c-diamide adenosyltransferase [Muribaculaceae bacterium]